VIGLLVTRLVFSLKLLEESRLKRDSGIAEYGIYDEVLSRS